MYKIKKKYLNMVLRYAMKNGFDVMGVYDKETWNKKGYKDSMLEKV